MENNHQLVFESGSESDGALEFEEPIAESDSDATIEYQIEDYEQREFREEEEEEEEEWNHIVSEHEASEHEEEEEEEEEHQEESDNAQYDGSESESQLDSDQDSNPVQDDEVDGHWPSEDSDEFFVFDISDEERVDTRSERYTDDQFRDDSHPDPGDRRLFMSQLKPAYRRRLCKYEEEELLRKTNQAKCTLPSPNRHGQDHPDDYWIKNGHYVKVETREENKILMQEWNRDKRVSSSRDGKSFIVNYDKDLTL